MTPEPAPDRPDLVPVQRGLRILVTTIVIVVLGVLALTAYLYQRFTTGVQLAP